MQNITHLLTAQQAHYDPGCHTVYLGLKRVHGQYTKHEAIVFLVEKKLAVADLRAAGMRLIPKYVQINDGTNTSLPTDVVESPQMRTLELAAHRINYGALNSHQQCHDCPIPGGVQMAPVGAMWVGTLGCAFGFTFESKWVWGALTNWHVANGGQFGLATKMVQPGQGNDWFGRLADWMEIAFDGSPNRVDAAVLDCRRTDGKYDPATDTVGPDLLDLGRTGQTVRPPTLNDLVSKSGRTTGVTHGKVTGVQATTKVGYGGGRTALFVDQILVTGEPDAFSAAGDSGSHVVTEEGHEPYGLLFAGGAGITVLNPFQAVLNAFSGGMFP